MSSHSPEPTPLIEAPKSRTPLLLGIVLALALAVAGLLVVLSRGDDGSTATDAGSEKVVLGVVGASDPYWETFRQAAAEEGIDLEVKDFADYAQPNPALSEGELDVNQFQHIIYLADYNVKNDDDLQPIGSTATYPLGLYSQKYDDVADIEAGETVVVPDDDTNQARGLLILQSAGLIELKDGGTPFSTVADIDAAASKVEVKAIKADLTPTSLPDVAAAIINNDFVENAGLSFDDAIAQDDPADPKSFPYVNIFAVRAEDKDDPTYLELVEVYQETQDVLDGVQETAGGTAEFVKVSPEELQASLAETEAQLKGAQ
jgi:D-methionine transport system substrate-binding protein